MTGLDEFGVRVAGLEWVTDLLVAGSLATGDYVPGVSDLDLVAVVSGPVGPERRAELVAVHRTIDPALNLGCVYVDEAYLHDLDARHPTWTHGILINRILSGVNRCELVLHGRAIFGREPGALLPPMTPDDVRAAARAELTGYWAGAARHPWAWLDPVIAELGLTSMARGRHALRTGTLLTKSAAVEQSAAPEWLRDQLRARRRGEQVILPRWRTGWIAWRDAVRTTRAAR